jgi:hypothetical protein
MAGNQSPHKLSEADLPAITGAVEKLLGLLNGGPEEDRLWNMAYYHAIIATRQLLCPDGDPHLALEVDMADLPSIVRGALHRLWRWVAVRDYSRADDSAVLIGIVAALIDAENNEPSAESEVEQQAGGAGDQRSVQPTVWYHGGHSYSRDGLRPVKVSNEMHNVLKPFLDGNIAINTKELQKSGVSNVASVIDKLVKKFGESPDGPICRPAAKGDGYFIRVRSLNRASH